MKNVKSVMSSRGMWRPPIWVSIRVLQNGRKLCANHIQVKDFNVENRPASERIIFYSQVLRTVYETSLTTSFARQTHPLHNLPTFAAALERLAGEEA